jgi:hypothetical protein
MITRMTRLVSGADADALLVISTGNHRSTKAHRLGAVGDASDHWARV